MDGAIASHYPAPHSCPGELFLCCSNNRREKEATEKILNCIKIGDCQIYKLGEAERERETGFGLALLAVTVPSWEPGALQGFHLF